MANEGIFLTPEESARDLGVSFAGGGKVIHKILKLRLNASKQRRLRISKLAMSLKGMHKIFSGAGFSASCWGHQVPGLSGPDVLLLERAAAQATGIHTGRCRFMANCVVYGPRGHPMARIIRDTMTLWFGVLNEIRDIGGTLYSELVSARAG